jgi:hypothetical protein
MDVEEDFNYVKVNNILNQILDLDEKTILQIKYFLENKVYLYKQIRKFIFSHDIDYKNDLLIFRCERITDIQCKTICDCCEEVLLKIKNKPSEEFEGNLLTKIFVLKIRTIHNTNIIKWKL